MELFRRDWLWAERLGTLTRSNLANEPRTRVRAARPPPTSHGRPQGLRQPEIGATPAGNRPTTLSVPAHRRAVVVRLGPRESAPWHARPFRHAAKKLRQVDRLGNVIIVTGGERLLPVLGPRVGRERDGRDLAAPVARECA